MDMASLWFWGKFPSRPLHLFGTTGMILLLGGDVSGVITILKYYERGHKISDTGWPLLTALLLIAGVQFFVFGLLADISAKTYRETTEDKSYSIREVMRND